MKTCGKTGQSKYPWTDEELYGKFNAKGQGAGERI